jgi:hypothetical protein
MIDTITAGSALPQRKSASTDHMPSLDGLRAISIALVLLGHLSGTRGFVRLDLGVGDYAHLGVVVFFVISGFLITRLLLSEHTKKGYVSFKLFYARRSLRLFPASYAFIACVLAWIIGVDPADQSLQGLHGGFGFRHISHQHQSRDSHSPLCLLVPRLDRTSPQLEADCVRWCSQLLALPMAAAFS